MVSVSLLEFAYANRPIYFEPETDLEVFDDDEEEWDPLFKSSYSFPTLIEALKSSEIEGGKIRFEDSVAQEYLYHLKETGIDDQLHHEDLMNRDRLVGFADGGYTTVDDLLGTADPVDISRDTGVDRDIVSSIATNYLDGFSSGSTFGDTGPLQLLNPKDSFTGWDLVEASSNRIRWVSPGRFNLTISPAPEGSTTIACNAPEAERNAWYRKGRSVEAGPDESLAPDEALEQAHEWLEAHQLEYEDDLAELPRIGAATKDYLALEFGIASREKLRTFAEDQPNEFDDIFGSPGSDLREALER
ncbi:hypothetical protein HSRCO_3003 (plasmid) [Halanaeroarchaeum sp. HSR-CO]|uniref:hypothetical protein n=1 Tax=Halanaeroarchaeum sp. HSR-CO TaxID=2866382 RepID=UPI00217E2C44|nr:hypothetical protein [Halanaeroarchaeum sp. HSR-CO]UWG49144.1 hypothetical protein HSRCO_3003 [Halanaeroarchaeum sp. HSR-CO]